MNSSMIGKIEKAHRYARNRNVSASIPSKRHFTAVTTTTACNCSDGHWRCSCHAFSTHVLGTCAHVMAIQQMMSPMLSEDDRYSGDEFAVTAEALPIAN